jgi:hypothetical protein
MKLSAIKPGRWYETTHGIGQCVNAGGTRRGYGFVLSVRFPVGS